MKFLQNTKLLTDRTFGSWCLWFSLFVTLMASMTMPVIGQDDEEEFIQEGFEEVSEDKKSGADPVALFKEAQTFHEKGELDRALVLYKKAVAEMPEFPEAEYQIASIYISKKQNDLAEAALRRAVSYRRDWTLALAALGRVLVSNKKYTEASENLEKAIRIDPKALDAYVGLTDLYAAKDPGKESYKKLYDRLSFYSTSARVPADIWSSKAAVELKLDLLDEASESISKSLRVSPGNLRARILEIEYALRIGDTEGAVSKSNSLYLTNPDSADYTLLLANSHLANQSSDKALEVLNKFPGGDPQITLMKSNISAGSETNTAELEKILAKDPRDIAALTSLCNSLRRGNPTKALDYCRRAYSLEPANAKHAVGFGAALVQLRKFDAAVRLLEDIKRRYPKNYTVRANLASAYFQMKAFEKAKQEYIWITTNSPEVHIAYYLLGISYDRLEEFTDAYVAYQTFVRIADQKKFSNEIERVTLRLSVLKDVVKKKK